MKIGISAGLALLLAGCTTIAERAPTMADSELCYLQVVTGHQGARAAVMEEIARRRTVCTQQMVDMHHQRSMYERETTRRTFQEAARAIAPPPTPQVQCTSYTSAGGVTTTNCQ